MANIKLIKIPRTNKQTIKNFDETIQNGINGKFYWSDKNINKTLKEVDIVLFFHPAEDKLIVTRKEYWMLSKMRRLKTFMEPT